MTLESKDWAPDETMKPDGRVRMPEGFTLTVTRINAPWLREPDPAVEALFRNFPPPQPSDPQQL